MLMPKRVKRRRVHRGHRRGKAHAGNYVAFGDFGLQALESCWMTANQIEAARIAMNRSIRRQGKIWIRIFPDKPFTKKPAETRMGSGKGAPEGWVAVIKPGRILFEMGGGVSEAVAKEAMRLASHKLPIDVKFVTREQTKAAAQADADDDGTDTIETAPTAMAVTELPVGSGAEVSEDASGEATDKIETEEATDGGN